MLDTYFNMTFLLEEGYTEKRGMAFLVWDIHKKIKNAEKTDETSEAGKALRKSLLNDQAASFITVPHNDQAQKKIEEYKKLLESPEFVEAEQEYQKVKKVNENPPWHMMFDGKRNTPELAKYLKLTSYYEELYRELSGPVHGTEIFNRVSNRDDERVDVGVVRSYTAAQHVASWTLHISYRMFDLYTQKRLTEKRDEYKEWVMSVKEAHQKICSSQTLIKEVE